MTKPQKPWHCQKCDCLGVMIPRAYPRSKLCKWCAIDLARAGQRWCSLGRHGAPAGEFTATSHYNCQACVAAYNKRQREANREKALAVSRAYHAQHREELVARSRAYYAANRERLLDQKKEYYALHREEIKAKVQAYRRRGLPASSRAKVRERHRAKHAIYKANEKFSRARRFIQALRQGSPQ